MAHTNSRILCIWQRKWNSTVCLNGKWYPDILLNLKIKQDDQALYLRFVQFIECILYSIKNKIQKNMANICTKQNKSKVCIVRTNPYWGKGHIE